MDWKKIRSGGFRYGLVYAGVTVLVIGFVTRSELAVAALFIVGLMLLLFVFGIGNVRTGDISISGQSYDVDSQLADAHIDQHEYVSFDQKLLFFAIGLAIFGFGGMVVLGG
ncbi:hypothetical protein [Salinigranum halophilum]|uniref:hypothetical protein n=1 Tax=Salinigranum halophilum TaxID=2565931 RepID=UPI00115CDEEF|nr:hypothetical protein [Salinigranum halophilum]